MVDGDIPAIGGLNTNDSLAMQQSGFSEGYINNYLFNRNNRGLGLDLGFNYHVSDKLLLEASVLDLGFIIGIVILPILSLRPGTMNTMELVIQFQFSEMVLVI